MFATSAWCAGPCRHSPTPRIPAGEEHEGLRVSRPGACPVDEQPRHRPEGRHQRQCPEAPSTFDPARRGQLHDDDDEGVDGEHEPDLALAEVRVVAGELGQQVEQRVAGGDEEEVQRPEAEERPVAEHGAIRPALRPGRRRGGRRLRDEPQDTDVDEERQCVELEEERE
jgi:hypothetical protein